MYHSKKIQYKYWIDIIEGRKNNEVRLNDENYSEGHTLGFSEVLNIPKEYEGFFKRNSHFMDWMWEITHVQEFPQGLQPGYVVLSLKKI